MQFGQLTTSFFVLALLAFGQSASAGDSTLRILNSLRMTECPKHGNDVKPLNANASLDAAAKYVKGGRTLRDALQRADYRADQSAMIHVEGPKDDASLKKVLAKNYCATLTDPGLVEAGIARTDTEIAVVFAAPFAPPSTADAAKVAQQVLRLVNEARAKTRKCGAKSFSAAPPLTLNAILAVAAQTHAKDMAAHGHMSHKGSDGSLPDERVTRTGYAWKQVGENVAMGQLSAKEVVDGWLSSPHHCENIMEPNFTQMAVAYAVRSKNETGIYWAQVFGRPR
jgi:uncharacterized protein YkwD